jgi:tRNA nucleotidyltransferase (CCA-adding enzyme)
VGYVNNIFDEILRKITPTDKEISLIGNITKNLQNLIHKKATELGISYTKIEPQGSTGIKQTQLKDDFDIDLFIGLEYQDFKLKYKDLSKNKFKKEIKKDFLNLCTNWIIPSLTSKEFQNPRLLYAEHPYVTVDYHSEEVKIKIDIVLYFDLELKMIQESGPITAVDRSPWHGRFILDNLSYRQKNDVRLLKQFFKSNHSYGDKSSLGKVGFIGYSAELLIYYFKNIINLFENFDKLKAIPLDYHNRDVKDLKKILHFQNDYLIIVDPIDKNRNVASAISERAYKYCNNRISKFIKNPNKSFFEIKPIPEIELKDLTKSALSKIFIIELTNLEKEIHYTINRDKLHSLGENIKSLGEKEFTHVEKFDTILYEVYFEDDLSEYNIALYCEKPNITKTYNRRGPSVKDTFHAQNFKKKNPNYYEEDGYFWVETNRDFNNFLSFLKYTINKKIPDNFEVINIENSLNTITSSGKKAITILTRMVLPYYLKNLTNFWN